MTNEIKKLIREIYDGASGHISGDILMGAIVAAVEVRSGVKVTSEDVVIALMETEPK